MPRYLCAPLVLLALAVGCGEGAPTKQEFIADLDKVCERSLAKIQAKNFEIPKSIKGYGSIARSSRPILEASIKEAEALELPDERGEEFEAYLEGNRKSLDELDELERAADAGDAQGVKRVLTETAAGNRKRDAQAKKLGLKRCGTT